MLFQIRDALETVTGIKFLNTETTVPFCGVSCAKAGAGGESGDPFGIKLNTATNGQRIASAVQLGTIPFSLGGPGQIARNVVFRELSAADRLAVDAGRAILPKGTGGTVLDQVRGLATGFISTARTVAGTARFRSGNGLVEIDLSVVRASGGRVLTTDEVLLGVGARPKQIQKVLEAEEFLIEGSIPRGAIRPVDF